MDSNGGRYQRLLEVDAQRGLEEIPSVIEVSQQNSRGLPPTTSIRRTFLGSLGTRSEDAPHHPQTVEIVYGTAVFGSGRHLKATLTMARDSR
jgi:hypothetical protein